MVLSDVVIKMGAYDIDIWECVEKINDAMEKKKSGEIEEAKELTKEFLVCLKKYDTVVYWDNARGKLIARSKRGQGGGWRRDMDKVMEILEIERKEDWERIEKELWG